MGTDRTRGSSGSGEVGGIDRNVVGGMVEEGGVGRYVHVSEVQILGGQNL